MPFVPKLFSPLKKLSCRSHGCQFALLAKGCEDGIFTVRKGFVPIYVGEECKRYVIPVELLSSPLVKELLEQSQEDSDEPKVDGPITLPCTTTDQFEKALKLLGTK